MRQKKKEGDVFRVRLKDDLCAFGRVLPKSHVAIYDLIGSGKESIDEVLEASVLFIVAVYDDIIKNGHWEIVGSKPLESGLRFLPPKFMQDSFDKSLSLYDSNTGEITPASLVDVEGLEKAAVWEAGHVEDRVLDHYYGRPNEWVERMKIRL